MFLRPKGKVIVCGVGEKGGFEQGEDCSPYTTTYAPKPKWHLERIMAGVNWESLSPCKLIIRSWRKSTLESAVIHVVVELGEMKYSAKFGNVGSFETIGGFLELECRAIRNSSMEASHWGKETRESNRGDFFKVTACYKLKAWLHPLLCSLLPIWVNGKAWNVSILDPSQGSLMTCLLFPTSTQAPVEPGENGHQGQFSKGEMSAAAAEAKKSEGHALRFPVAILANDHRSFGTIWQGCLLFQSHCIAYQPL